MVGSELVDPYELNVQTYIQFREIFRDGKAHFRKAKSILKVIKSLDCRDIKEVSKRTHATNEAVFDALVTLLSSRVFENPAIAQARFPSLFQSSTAQVQEMQQIESEVAKSEACAIAETSREEPSSELRTVESAPVSSSTDKKGGTNSEPTSNSIFDPPISDGSDSDSPRENSALRAPTRDDKGKENEESTEIEQQIHILVQKKIPNLFPVYFSYPLQHKLMTTAQKLLEQACFNFAEQWMPKDVKKEQFKYPENAELPMWARLILRRRSLSSVPSESYDETILGKQSLADIVKIVEDLRHTAVHRLKTQSKGTELLLKNALLFAQFLKDEETSRKLQIMVAKTEELSASLENEKILKRNLLEKQLVDIERQRRSLDEREKDALQRIREDDQSARDRAVIDLKALFADKIPTESEAEDSGVEILDLANPVDSIIIGNQSQTLGAQQSPVIKSGIIPPESELPDCWDGAGEFGTDEANPESGGVSLIKNNDEVPDIMNYYYQNPSTNSSSIDVNMACGSTNPSEYTTFAKRCIHTSLGEGTTESLDEEIYESAAETIGQ